MMERGGGLVIHIATAGRASAHTVAHYDSHPAEVHDEMGRDLLVAHVATAGRASTHMLQYVTAGRLRPMMRWGGARLCSRGNSGACQAANVAVCHTRAAKVQVLQVPERGQQCGHMRYALAARQFQAPQPAQPTACRRSLPPEHAIGLEVCNQTHVGLLLPPTYRVG